MEPEASETMRCVDCKSVCTAEDLFIIDDQPVCRTCLFGDVLPMRIYPIGIVLNDQARDNTAFGRTGTGKISRVELFSGQERFMYRLDEEAGLTIVYYLHKSRPVKTRFNRGIDGKCVGVFASRTPDRLSRIGIQNVTLLKVNGTSLTVEGLDAISGTPVLDIKLKV